MKNIDEWVARLAAGPRDNVADIAANAAVHKALINTNVLNLGQYRTQCVQLVTRLGYQYSQVLPRHHLRTGGGFWLGIIRETFSERVIVDVPGLIILDAAPTTTPATAA